jgi:hypothetical protein
MCPMFYDLWAGVKRKIIWCHLIAVLSATYRPYFVYLLFLGYLFVYCSIILFRFLFWLRLSFGSFCVLGFKDSGIIIPPPLQLL